MMESHGEKQGEPMITYNYTYSYRYEKHYLDTNSTEVNEILVYPVYPLGSSLFIYQGEKSKQKRAMFSSSDIQHSRINKA